MQNFVPEKKISTGARCFGGGIAVAPGRQLLRFNFRDGNACLIIPLLDPAGLIQIE